jgi:hypothetical protein
MLETKEELINKVKEGLVVKYSDVLSDEALYKRAEILYSYADNYELLNATSRDRAIVMLLSYFDVPLTEREKKQVNEIKQEMSHAYAEKCESEENNKKRKRGEKL